MLYGVHLPVNVGAHEIDWMLLVGYFSVVNVVDDRFDVFCIYDFFDCAVRGGHLFSEWVGKVILVVISFVMHSMF